MEVRQYHARKLTRKITGGKVGKRSDKRKAHAGGYFAAPKIGKQQIVVRRTRGGKRVAAIKSAEFANVAAAGKVQRAKILRVVETPGNPQLARAGIIIKGAIIETELGTARVTSRPRHGVVNAVLIA